MTLIVLRLSLLCSMTVAPKYIWNHHPWGSLQKLQNWSLVKTFHSGENDCHFDCGIMALLVGALSVRRMRSRHFLLSCVENESLEDALAYHAAYTTGGTGSYDTFGAAHWKGGLEKIDV